MCIKLITIEGYVMQDNIQRGDTVQDQGSVMVETEIQVEHSKHMQVSKFSTICFPVLESEWSLGKHISHFNDMHAQSVSQCTKQCL